MSKKPKIAVLSLGGTIAMAGAGEKGVLPSLDAKMLVDAVPQLRDVADVEAASFLQVASPEIDFDDLDSLSVEIKRRIEGGAQGVVITQGTDSIEETSFVLDRLIAMDAPVVVTGAMRNPTMAGADGPANLLGAVRVAASQSVRGLGTVVFFNDQIHAARYVQKRHTASTAAFMSPLMGPLGWIAEGQVRILHRPVGMGAVSFSAKPLDAPVALIMQSLGDDGRLIDAACDAGYRGMVIAATGGGHVPENVADKLERAAARMPVILASRVGAGELLRETYGFKGSETDLLGRGLINAGWLDPLKARLLLALHLRCGSDAKTIGAVFADWLDGMPS